MSEGEHVSSSQQAAGAARHAASQTAGTAKAEASGVAETTASAAADVAGTAKEQAGTVVQDALTQVRGLVDQTGSAVSEQAGQAASSLAQTVRSWAEELSELVSSGEHRGPAAGVVRQVADRGHRFAGYLEQRGPEDLLGDLRRGAARRPGRFLLGALAAGVVSARLTRGLRAAQSEQGSPEIRSGTSVPTTPRPVVIPARVPTVPVTVDQSTTPGARAAGVGAPSTTR